SSSSAPPPPLLTLLFFLNHPPPPEIYPLSLHDALPICRPCAAHPVTPVTPGRQAAAATTRPPSRVSVRSARPRQRMPWLTRITRSEEHTSELQSLTNLVCRLLLEKKKNT